MMMYYKKIENDSVVSIGTVNSSGLPEGFTEIAQAEYEELQEQFLSEADEEDIAEEENAYGIDDELYNQIIDDYTAELMEGGML